MKCEAEGCDAEATVHLTKVVNELVKKVHLCASCAEKQGVDISQPEKISDLILAGASASISSGLTQCSVCGINKRDWKKGGRLGCGDCYKAFSGELASMVRSMHKSDEHVGKVPARMGARALTKRKLSKLRQEMARAVTHEDFEEAARLKSEITSLETEL